MLFNKDGQGSLELAKITGTFKASTDYATIETDIADAMAELRTMVGSVVDTAETAYEAGKNPELVAAVQRPVAARALCFFAKKNGLAHGETGRKIRVDENEKIPFEWMVDRDDRELLERYYRSLDTLLSYLVSHETEGWSSSPAALFKKSGLLVESLADFEQVYPLHGSWYTFHLLTPLMMEAQKRLETYLGAVPEKTYDALKYIVLSALDTALGRWPLKIFPLEVSRQFSPTYQGNQTSEKASLIEIDRIRKAFRKEIKEAYAALSSKGGDQDIVRPKNTPDQKFFTV